MWGQPPPSTSPLKSSSTQADQMCGRMWERCESPVICSVCSKPGGWVSNNLSGHATLQADSPRAHCRVCLSTIRRGQLTCLACHCSCIKMFRIGAFWMARWTDAPELLGSVVRLRDHRISFVSYILFYSVLTVLFNCLYSSYLYWSGVALLISLCLYNNNKGFPFYSTHHLEKNCIRPSLPSHKYLTVHFNSLLSYAFLYSALFVILCYYEKLCYGCKCFNA